MLMTTVFWLKGVEGVLYRTAVGAGKEVEGAGAGIGGLGWSWVTGADSWLGEGAGLESGAGAESESGSKIENPAETAPEVS